MMIATLTLCLFPCPSDAWTAADCVVAYHDATADDPEFETKVAAAGKEKSRGENGRRNGRNEVPGDKSRGHGSLRRFLG